MAREGPQPASGTAARALLALASPNLDGNSDMTNPIRPLIAGNWKMNGLRASIAEFEAMLAGASQIGGKAELLADAGASAVIVGHSERRADHGESDGLVRQKAEAAWRAGLAAIVCVGETQRHRDSGQTLEVCGGQLKGSLPDGARADNLFVAYEPVWAIGTGVTPTTEDVKQIHHFIRELLIERFNGEGSGIRILYGGSVKPSNARELMAVPNVNGALVGGASLKATDFLAIAGDCP